MQTKYATALALALMLAAGTASAGTQDEAKEANALQNTKTTLSQAIASAEQQTGGRAFDAGVDLSTGKPQIIVETNGPKGVQTVTVNAQTGGIVGTRAGGVAD